MLLFFETKNPLKLIIIDYNRLFFEKHISEILLNNNPF